MNLKNDSHSCLFEFLYVNQKYQTFKMFVSCINLLLSASQGIVICYQSQIKHFIFCFSYNSRILKNQL